MKPAWRAQLADAPCMAAKPGEIFDCAIFRAGFDESISGRRNRAIIVQLVLAGNVFFTETVLISTGTVALAAMVGKTELVAARFNDYLSVVAGTTLGMVLANSPVVW